MRRAAAKCVTLRIFSAACRVYTGFMATNTDIRKTVHARIVFSLILSLLPCALAAQTWQNITQNAAAPLTAIRSGMVSDGQRLFVLGGSNGTGVLVSNDGGNTFTPLNAVANAAYTLDDAGQVHGLGYANGRVWFMASSGDASFNYLHSLAPGATEWEQAGLSGFPPPIQIGSFGAITDIVYVPESGLYFCIAELGGVYSSADGRNWEKRSSGFDGSGAVASLEAIDGKVFAIRPLSGGPKVSADNGLSWASVSPFTGFDGANLQRIGDTLVFVVSGGNSAAAYLGLNGGTDWLMQQGLPFGLWGNLNGDGELLFSHRTFPNTHLMFSATLGITWQELPVDPLTLNPVGGNFVGVISPVFPVRHGQYLFLLATETVNASFGTEPRLYRLDLSTVDLTPALTIVRQPQSFERVTGKSGSLSVFAVGEGLSYQWFKEGVAIDGANGATLDLGILDESKSGNYTVTVSGSGTQLNSAVASVQVLPPRGDGQYDPDYAPGIKSSGDLLGLPDGGLILIRSSTVYRLDADGNLLSSRSLARSFSFEGFNFKHQIIDSQGRLVAAGYARGSDTSTNQRIRRFDADTLQDDPSFTVQSGFDSAITDIQELPGRGYLITGQFNSIRSTAVSRLVLISYSGVLDSEFAAGLQLTPQEVVVGTDQSIYIRGDFGGTPYRRMVRVDANGQVVEPWGPVTDLIYKMHPLSGGRVLLASARNSQHSVDVILPNGTPDPTFNTAATFNDDVLAAAEQDDGRIIVVGAFTTYAGAPAVGHFRFLADGVADPEYNATAGFSSGPITSVVTVPGFAYFSSYAPENATFQGSPAFGAGPVRVFAGDRPADIRPILGNDFVDTGDGWFLSPVLGWLYWDGLDGLIYSASLRAWVHVPFDGNPIDSDQGFWMGIFRDGSMLWAFTHKLFWGANANDPSSGYLYVYNGLDGAPAWFFFDAMSNVFIRL